MRIDARPGSDRIPPGQIETRKWPVLHAGRVPSVDARHLAIRRRRAGGPAASRCRGMSCSQCRAQETLCDIHCVTRWSRLDNIFGGVPVRALLERAGVQPAARYVLVHADAGLHHQPAARRSRPSRRTCSRSPGRRRAAHAGARRAGAAAGAAPLFLEERQVGPRARAARRTTSRASGSEAAITCAAIRGARSASAGPIRCACGAASATAGSAVAFRPPSCHPQCHG